MRGPSVIGALLAEMESAVGLAPSPSSLDPSARLDAVRAHLAEHEFAYLVLALFGTEIPAPDHVIAFARATRLDAGALSKLVRSAARRRFAPTDVPKIESRLVIDVTDTAASNFTTGIQRVVREVVPRWSTGAEVVTAAWDRTGRRLRETPLDGGAAVGRPIVPFGGLFVLPEIAVHRPRAFRLATIARFGGGRSAAIGFDCIPMTTAEVAGPGMPGAFANYLATLASFDLVVPISDAAAGEYRGWKRMLSGAGLSGPAIEPVDLAYDAGAARSASADEVRTSVGLEEGERVVVVVGSHEPRKNHLRVLAAAERLWASGRTFALVHVGGNAWSAEAFEREVERLVARGRRVITISRAPDDIVWGLYALAEVSAFPSLNEGFGLPVVESLALGTPVVTSDFGSMRDLGEGRGAVLVDPRDTTSIARALDSVLSDPERRAQLVALTATLPRRSWDDYARESWEHIGALLA